MAVNEPVPETLPALNTSGGRSLPDPYYENEDGMKHSNWTEAMDTWNKRDDAAPWMGQTSANPPTHWT